MPGVKRPARHRRPAYFRQWRNYRRMTLEQVAKAIGYDHSNIQRLETGKIPYSQDIVELLAREYRCEPADLISRDPTVEERRPPEPPIKDQVAAALAELLAKGLK